jgi:hypothetical protein
MKKMLKIGIGLLLGAMIFLALTGCPTPTEGAAKLNSNALLTSVTVAGVTATLGNPGTDWEETIMVGNLGHVYLSRPLLGQAEVVVQASSGAVVYMAQAKATVEPYFLSGTVFDFDADDYLFIEVFSQNHDAFNVYAIQVHSRNPGLTDITFDGRSLYGGVLASGRPFLKFGDPGRPGETWNSVKQEGEALFDSKKEGEKVRITFRPEVPYLKIWTAVVSDNTEPDFSTGGFNGTSTGWDLTNGKATNGEAVIDGAYSAEDPASGIYITLANDSFIYVKVQGGSEDELSFYKLKMTSKSNNKTMTNPRFEIYDGTTLVETYPVETGQMGLNNWAGGENYGNYDDGAELPGNTGTTQSVTVSNKGILSLYLDSDMTGDLAGVPGSDETKDQHIGTRPPANLRVVFKAEFDGTLTFCQPRKNQRDEAVFNVTSGDFGNLVGFWWWGVEVTSGLGEKGWYKYATRIGSQKADILDSLTINGVTVDFTGVEPAYASAHYDPDNDFTYATVTLPANTNFGSALQVAAKGQTGYYPLISVASAPDHITNVTNPAFNESQEKNFNSATGEWSGAIPPIEPGGFIYVRTTAEISWYYGGSGFTGPTWAPSRNVTTAATRYGVQRFYKVQVLKAGAQDGADMTDISNKGTALSATVANAKITQTDTANALTSTDRKGNAEVGCTVKTEWTSQTDNDVKVADFASPDFAAVLDTNSSSARVAFALRQTATEVVNVTDDKGNVTSSYLSKVQPDQFSAPAKFNAETNVQSNTWLVARITSESGKSTNFYRFHLLNNDGNSTTPASVSFNSGTAITELGTANNAATGTTVITTKLANKAAFDSVTINVTKPHANASVAIGLTGVNNAAPAAYTDATGTGTAASATFTYVPIAQFAVIRVISADRTATMFYKFRLELDGAKTETTISAITIGGAGNSVTPLPAANAAGNGPTFVTYDIPGEITVLNNLQVSVTPAVGATVGYASAANATTAPTDYSNTTGLFPIFTNGNYLVIRVMAEDNITASYYKVLVMNTWTVSFDTNGGNPSTIEAVKVIKDGTMGTLFPAAPTLSGKRFGGWYLSSDTDFSGTRYIATTAISEAVSLKAKWDELPSGSGNANIRAVSGTGPNTLYGLYMGGQPGTSNGTPGDDIASVGTNGTIGGSSATVVAGKKVVVIVEDDKVSKVEYAINSAASPASVTWKALTKDETNNISSLTDKRWVGTLEAADNLAASGTRYIFVRITAENTVEQVYRYSQYLAVAASGQRATLSALTIGGVNALATAGTPAGWWNATVAPDLVPGTVTLSGDTSSITVASTFTNASVNAVTSVLRIPKDDATWPFTEEIELEATDFVSSTPDTGTAGGTQTTLTVTDIADGDYILIRYIPTTAGNYLANLGHYLIKVTVED